MNEDIILGKIKWNRAGFDQLNGMLTQLLVKPKDDWNTADLEEFFSNELRMMGITPYDPMAQVYCYLADHYPDLNDAKAYFVRYNNILRFLRDYHNDLLKIGFVVKKGKQDLVKDELLEVLCEVPFHGMDDKGQPVFAFDDVIDAAWARINKRGKGHHGTN